METTEIRHHKGKLVLQIVLFLAGVVGLNLYVRFSGFAITSSHLTVLSVLMILAPFIAFYSGIKRTFNNEPYLVLTRQGITIYMREVYHFEWDQLTSWEIQKEADRHYLILTTIEESKKFGLSSLDKKPQEIETLMNSYKKM